jgi:hypothetical protein
LIVPSPYTCIDVTDVSVTPSGYLWPLHQRVVCPPYYSPARYVYGIFRLSLTRHRGGPGRLLVSLSRITPDFPIVIRGYRTNALISTCHPQSLAPIFLGEFARQSTSRIERVGAKDESHKTRVLARFPENPQSSPEDCSFSRLCHFRIFSMRLSS